MGAGVALAPVADPRPARRGVRPPGGPLLVLRLLFVRIGEAHRDSATHALVVGLEVWPIFGERHREPEGVRRRDEISLRFRASRLVAVALDLVYHPAVRGGLVT